MIFVQLFLLAFIAPFVLNRFGRIALAVWIPVLVGFAIWHAAQGARIDRALGGRATIALSASSGSRPRVTIAPFPDVEAVHVSLKKDGRPLKMEDVERSPARWKVLEEYKVEWFHDGNRSMELSDDGTPLFEIRHGPMKGPLTLEYDAQACLEGAALHVRPDGFSLKMLAPSADFYRLIGGAYVAGALLTAILLGAGRRKPASAPAAP